MKPATLPAIRVERCGIALAAQKIDDIGAGRIGFDIGEFVARIGAGQIARRRRHRGQVGREGQWIVGAVEPAEIEHRRDHHDAGDADAFRILRRRASFGARKPP